MIHNSELPRPEAVLPHRPPHLWVDGVTLVEAGVSASGFWTPGQEHFEGHFPGMPLLQGVKQVESLAQLGAYAIMVGAETPVLGIFKGIDSTRFERPVRPNETLSLRIEIVDKSKRDFKGIGVAQVDDEIACQTTILGSILPEKIAQRLLGQR